jgi:hypothetical protein
MIALKLSYLGFLLAAAGAASDNEEWRYFAGLLVGALLSALAGMAMLLMSGKPVLRQIITARLMANGVFGLGVGACVVYFAGHNDWPTGPMFTVGASFLCGIFGVGLVKLLEPMLKRRLERYIDRFTGGADEAPASHTDRATAPTVKLVDDSRHQ